IFESPEQLVAGAMLHHPHDDVTLYFFFYDPATTQIYTTRHTLSLHDALPICPGRRRSGLRCARSRTAPRCGSACGSRSEEHTSELQSRLVISYAVFCLKIKRRPTANPISLIYLASKTEADSPVLP